MVGPGPAGLGVSWEAVVEAVASGTGASIGVAALARKWFRAAVRDVVDDAMADVIKRQERVMLHLDLQDRRLERIERKLSQR